MDSFTSKSKIGKRFSTNNSEEKIENVKMEMEELTKSLGSSKKTKDEERGFVFSLSHFDEKNRESKGSNNKNEVVESGPIENEKRESMDRN